MKVKNLWVVILIIVLLMVSILILVKNYNEGIVGSKNEVLNVKIKECCKYIQAGEEKTCSVLEGKSCDYCNRYCS